MEQRYVDALIFTGLVLAVFGFANLWEAVKRYVRTNR
jgi:hypothetical protein